MALNNYGADGFVLTINDRIISDWGFTDPPYTDDPIDQKSTLLRGMGGGAVKLKRTNPGRRVTLNLIPGSPNSDYMQGLFVTDATITLSKQQVGTLESALGSEGTIVNDGQSGRAGGASVTDDQFIIEFNSWNESKGGD